MYKTYDECIACGGSGVYRYPQIDAQGNVIEVVQDPCQKCGGTGNIKTGTLDGAEEIDWIKKKIKKILNKLDIPEEES